MSLATLPPTDSEGYRSASSWIQLVIEPMDSNSFGQTPVSEQQYYDTPSGWRREPGYNTTVQPPPWAPNQVSAPPMYPMPRLYPIGFDSQNQMGLSGGLPIPGTAPRPYLPYLQPMPAPHVRPWIEGLPQNSAPVPVQPNPLGMQYAQPGMFPRQALETELGQGQSAVALEPDAQPQNGYTPHHPAPPMGQFPGPLLTPMTSAPMPMPQIRRLSYQSLPGTPPRASRVPLSPPFGAPPQYHDPSQLPAHTYRRSGHSRARRPVNNRLTAADMSRNSEENGTHDASAHRLDQGRVVSQLQGAAGTANEPTTQQANQPSAEKVTMRVARSFLQKVSIQDLPESERACVICYNDFGVKTPEGIQEEPLRLPKCKHVFGNHCLTKWFKDSDSCPYCRDKLELVPKHPDNVVSQLFTAMMSARHQLPPGAPEEMYLRLMSNLMNTEGIGGSQELGMSERRPLHAHGDSDSSSYDDETTPPAPSREATATSPVRNPLRENARLSQWLARAPLQRGAHPPSSQERETSRHRRHRLPRGNNLSIAPNPDSDSSDPSLSPPYAQQTDGAAQASPTTPSVNAEDSGGPRNDTDINSQVTNNLVASTVLNRIRPW